MNVEITFFLGHPVTERLAAYSTQVWKGTGGTARVKMLEPGRGYRFRVRCANCDGQEGPVSESVVRVCELRTQFCPDTTVRVIT